MKDGSLEQEKMIHGKAYRKAVNQMIQRHSEEFMLLYRAERKAAMEKAGLRPGIFRRK